MHRLFLFLISSFLFSTAVEALQLSTSLNPSQNEWVLRSGFNGLIGVVSPNSSFKHPEGFSDAKLFEEYLGVSYGLGNLGLKDLVIETKGTLYHSGKETYNGSKIHNHNNGGYLSFRALGNFIHLPRFILGISLGGDIPIGMSKQKFVKPNVNYLGGGLSASGQLLDNFYLGQSVFLGSGLFSPRTKNLNFISNTFPSANLGQLLSNFDLTMTTGLSVEADLTKRTDQAYQQSSFADGKIQNLVFVTPFIFTMPIFKDLMTQGGIAVKWAGRSSRGSMFFNFELAYRL